MIARRIATARPLYRAVRAMPLPSSRAQRRHLAQDSGSTAEWVPVTSDADDPNMNGGYINPPAEKRQFRDPYADWWDKQERRNYGEPVHEDNDILGMFSPDEYTHYTPAKGFFLLGCFVTTFAGLCGVVSLYYPDKPSAPRTFPGGLETELGGPNALPARKHEDID